MRRPDHTDQPPCYHAILTDESENHPPEKSFNDTKGPFPFSPVLREIEKPTGSDYTWLKSASNSHEIYDSIQRLLRDLIQKRASNSTAILPILSSCAKTCVTYGLSFSHLLQQRYIEKRTILYWVIVTRLSDAHPAAVEENKGPDVLTALLSYASPLKDETITDIRQACLASSDQNTFKRLAQFPGFARMSGTDQMLLGVETPLDVIEVEETSEASAIFSVNFVIRQFHKRIAISKRIALEFIVQSRLWRLTFLERSDGKSGPSDSWLVSLSLQENSPPTQVKSCLSILEASSSSSTPVTQPHKAPGSDTEPSPSGDDTMCLLNSTSYLQAHTRWGGGREISEPLGKIADKLGSYIDADGNLRARLVAE